MEDVIFSSIEMTGANLVSLSQVYRSKKLCFMFNTLLEIEDQAERDATKTQVASRSDSVS
jgi:hypothetical protein